MSSQTIPRASQLLQKGDLAGAESVLVSLLRPGIAADPQALCLLGRIRLQQKRLAEAESFFRQARAANAGRLQNNLVEANYELGCALHAAGQLGDAERVFRDLLEALPAPARLMLGAVLIDAKRPVEAEEVLQAGLAQPAPAALKAALHCNLALALRRQRKDQEALENYDQAAALNPGLAELQIHRAESLQNLGRDEAAVAAYRAALAAEPLNPVLHRLYNDLLGRLGRAEEGLKSYDTVPATRALQLEKARSLSQQGRGIEAEAIYGQLLAKDGGDKLAWTGKANALVLQKRHGDAAAIFDGMLARFGDDTELLQRAADAAISQGDPPRALAYCERGLAQARYDQKLLASMSTALRMMQDERDEALSGYDSLIRVFDLPPPEGFSSIETFNAELGDVLARLHTETHAPLHQSLRGGSQTPDHLFGAGHDLVERLQQRIAQAVSRYIAELKEDESHPFLSRRRPAFQYAGSWSSRLSDCGFHVNHIHPEGWISSCYYVSLPDEAKDQETKQGWIKFGEPSLDLGTAVPVRRYVPPVPGRLILFPSYVWHGTTAFHSGMARTTIAFDALPLLP
ncbi:MAG TPA: putative 2OG-Fe(II) oxygenase [Rhizomicrobium sp.]|nr:putative 2OG-Fe(II) oxygenase [Rhizomicrobium sp.]